MMEEGIIGGGGFCIGRNIEMSGRATGSVPVNGSVDDRPAALCGFLGDTYRGHWFLSGSIYGRRLGRPHR